MTISRWLSRVPMMFLLVLTLCGCAGGGWGGSTGFARGWQEWGSAARGAALKPEVWAPLAGAVVLGAADLDDNITDWAVRKQPLFGANASDVSDDLLDASTGVLVVSALLAPADDTGDRISGLAAQLGTVALTGGVTEGLKKITKRRRPNDRDNNALPSGHASQAAVRTALARTNFSYHEVPKGVRIASDVALHSLAYATAWARVEANRHHPSDVLAGVAIGNFFAEFLRLALFEGHKPRQGEVAVDVVPGGAVLRLSVPLK